MALIYDNHFFDSQSLVCMSYGCYILSNAFKFKKLRKIINLTNFFLIEMI